MEVLGVIGNPISHSLSPKMHNAAFHVAGKEGIYIPLLVNESQLEQAIKGAKALGFTGLNVTVPFKEKVIPYLTDLTETAETIGSVNTIKFTEDAVIGHSTDGLGFEQAAQIELGLDFSGRKILLIGAGGAARAITSQLLKHDCMLYITNRTYSRAQRLASDLGKKQGHKISVIKLEQNWLKQVIPAVDIIVNTTSVGMKETIDQTPIPTNLLHKKQTVIDIIYNPKKSLLLKTAEEKGCRTQNGVGMLVWQAVKSWEFWWGVIPPLDVMYQAVKASLL
ncbi:MAG: shikimate dehydrogenase [Firmicutes bacterium]|nr:shikimate dehydrogenase [Bacillota bacterium]